jgi:hypothetical protein
VLVRGNSSLVKEMLRYAATDFLKLTGTCKKDPRIWHMPVAKIGCMELFSLVVVLTESLVK